MFHKNPGIIINTVQENEVAKYSQKILFGITLEKFSNEPFIMESDFNEITRCWQTTLLKRAFATQVFW